MEIKPFDTVKHNGKKCKVLSVTKKKAVIFDGQFTINVWIKDLKPY